MKEMNQFFLLWKFQIQMILSLGILVFSEPMVELIRMNMLTGQIIWKKLFSPKLIVRELVEDFRAFLEFRGRNIFIGTSFYGDTANEKQNFYGYLIETRTGNLIQEFKLNQ